jgi:type I restriction enzyme S subunit
MNSERVRLSEALRTAPVFVDGDWIESKDQDPDGDVRLIQLADVGIGRFIDKSRRFLTAETAQRLNCTFLERGDILIARMPDPIGRACIFPGVGQPAVTAVDVCIVRVDPDVLDSRYLVHYLNSSQAFRQISGKASGSTRQRISRSNLGTIEIPLPPLEEQRRIAAILDKAQDLSLRSWLSNQLASSLIESEMIQRFDRPGRVQAQSALLTLVDAGVTVIDCPHSTPKWTEDGKICLRTSNLGKGDWIWQDTRYISDDDFRERSRRAPVEPGDIVLSREGTVGIAAIVASNMEVCMGQRLVQLKLGTSRLMPEYLLAQLLYLLKPERISHAMTGSTSKHINVKDLRELKVHCPPIEEQLDFENFCKSAKKLRSTIGFLNQKSDMLSRSIQMASFKS